MPHNPLAGIMIKNHFESTVGRAALADRMVEGTRVFGGLARTRSTGGLNPLAAETALRLGARQIRTPTVDATAHAAHSDKLEVSPTRKAVSTASSRYICIG